MSEAARDIWPQVTGSPVPHDEFDAVVHGRRIRVRMWGDPGTPIVVLVHGGAAHGGWWDWVAPILADRFRVLVPDLSGAARSDHGSDYSYEGWAKEVLAVAAHQLSPGVAGRPVVIGHSRGGTVALHAARDPDAGLGGVIVVETALRRYSEEELAPYRMRSARGHRCYPTKEQALARFALLPSAERVSEEVFSAVAEQSVMPTPKGWTWRFDPKSSDPVPLAAEDLFPVSCPVALVRAQDGTMTEQMCAEARRYIGQDCPVFEILDAGHHVPLERPAKLAAVLRPLIDDWSLR